MNKIETFHYKRFPSGTDKSRFDWDKEDLRELLLEEERTGIPYCQGCTWSYTAGGGGGAVIDCIHRECIGYFNSPLWRAGKRKLAWTLKSTSNWIAEFYLQKAEHLLTGESVWVPTAWGCFKPQPCLGNPAGACHDRNFLRGSWEEAVQELKRYRFDEDGYLEKI